MAGRILLSEQVASSWLLILSGQIFLVGAMLYTGRAIWKWPVGQTHSYLLWERGFVFTALLVVAIGLAMLERRIEAAGDGFLAPVGMMIYWIGTVLVLVAETFFISREQWVYAPIVAFIVLAFLGQAILGAALLRTGLLPGWVGWATILWNLGWLVVLPIARPMNMYYPWLHFVAPLLIGISLLSRR